MGHSSFSVDQDSTILTNFLARHPLVKYIIYLTVDYGNVARCLLTTTARAADISMGRSGGVTSASSMQFASWAITGTDDDVEIILEGSAHWVPQWESVRLSFREDQAVVMCSLEEMKEIQEDRLARDPRTALANLVKTARKDHGLEFQIGYEIEFHLLSSLEPRPSGPNEGAYSMTAVRESHFDVVLEAVDAMERAGIKTWTIHPEVCKDEYEISLAPRDPLGAVDDLIHAQAIIRGVARRHGLYATMHPQRYEDGPTIGNHTHISLNKPQMADAFLAGLVKGLPSVSAILLGGHDSFGRGEMLGDGIVGWSYGKFTPIRRFGHAHFENRVPDCLANPYIQLTALIGTGLDGVKNQWDLPTIEKHARNARLPATQSEALTAMNNNAETLRPLLGSKLFDTYVKFKQTECEKAGKMTRKNRSEAIVKHI